MKTVEACVPLLQQGMCTHSITPVLLRFAGLLSDWSGRIGTVDHDTPGVHQGTATRPGNRRCAIQGIEEEGTGCLSCTSGGFPVVRGQMFLLDDRPLHWCCITDMTDGVQFS